MMRDVHGHDVDGGQGRSWVIRFFQILEGRSAELVLRKQQRRVGQTGGRVLGVGWGWICRRGMRGYTVQGDGSGISNRGWGGIL